MEAAFLDHPVIKCNKLTIFSANNKTNEWKVAKYLVQNWKTLTVGLENATILFMGGVHGDESGAFEREENIQVLKNQVSTS